MADKKFGALFLKVDGGKPPYHWFVNGQYINNNSNNEQSLVRSGKQKITVIDSLGRQNHSDILVKLSNEKK
jgi:membrane carboxypeptidase/penicillin-binding protein PbpC